MLQPEELLLLNKIVINSPQSTVAATKKAPYTYFSFCLEWLICNRICFKNARE